MRGEVLVDDVARADRSPARTARGDLDARSRSHGSSPRTGGTLKRSSSTAGRLAEHLVAVERRADLVGAAARW